MSTGNVFEIAPQAVTVERRAHQRIKAVIPAELRPDGSEAALRVQTADLSLGGCYVNMIFTLEVGRMVELTLSLKSHDLKMRGVVVSRHPRRGNGIMFLEIAREDRIRLQNFLKAKLDEGVERPQ